MYYQNYEDYMRSVLGYPVDNQNTYQTFQDYSFPSYESSVSVNRNSNEIMELYPEIYRVVNPMVQKICEVNTKPITRELIDEMTEEICLNLEGDVETNSVVNLRVNIPRESISENKNINKTSNTKNNRNSNEKTENMESRQIRRNPFLQDLIRILILNQLLGGNIFHRPPRPRPPFPRPPRPPMRPPFPRDYNNYSEF